MIYVVSTRHKSNGNSHVKQNDESIKKYYCLCGNFDLHNQNLYTHKKKYKLLINKMFYKYIMSFVCDLCGRSFSRQDSLTRHKANVNSHVKQNDESIKKYYCLCGNFYIHNQSLYTHKKKCKIALENPNVKQKEVLSTFKNTQRENEELKKERESLKQEIELLKQTKSGSETEPKVINNNTTNNNSHNKTQNNVTIQINAVGYENLDHITDQIIVESIGKVFNSIPTILKHINYDPEHPENLNILIPNKKEPYARVFKKKSGKWETVHRDEAIDDMVDRGYDFLDDNYPSVKDKISETNQKHFKRFQDNFGTDPNVKKIIKKDVDMMVMNATRK